MREPAGSGPAPSDAAPAGEVAAERARLVSYVVLFAAAAGLYVVSLSLPTSRWEPLGAGSFPRLVMVALGALSLVAALGSVRKLRRLGAAPAANPLVAAFFARHRVVVAVFAAFAVYLALLRPLGFAVATFLFLLAAQLLIARWSWRGLALAIVVAAVFSFGLNFLFATVFMVFLPRGILG
ncbi:tripartite tricarboxylate transporter TctB family protein [Acuticoccus mangrovi]|uniref:Tripartite tricarboxylate transporter TctB family protein n=1 Tax=Acuticoccus mangrovi TaxID=2796142 RepID=A0A934IU53_9HYPH|nr:tripartite tricarboxylate transporter TctB family protein [Acuticoccus mangrovi]MBJ3778790.1 tripartite tricarboxylate transporter TctB family protein [Acuticoccus mangrovi]